MSKDKKGDRFRHPVDDKEYEVVKGNCNKCMGKRYMLRDYVDRKTMEWKESVSICGCVKEVKIKSEQETEKEVESG